jgi:hypothetical protein
VRCRLWGSRVRACCKLHRGGQRWSWSWLWGARCVHRRRFVHLQRRYVNDCKGWGYPLWARVGPACAARVTGAPPFALPPLAGFGGEDCTGFSCAGIQDCSGHGNCTLPDTCECDEGWLGAACSTPDCSSVGGCSGEGRGLCTGPAQCTCLQGFSGTNCSSMAACPAVHNCSHHGVCTSPTACLCFDGFSGPSCTDIRWGIDTVLYAVTAKVARLRLLACVCCGWCPLRLWLHGGCWRV